MRWAGASRTGVRACPTVLLVLCTPKQQASKSSIPVRSMYRIDDNWQMQALSQSSPPPSKKKRNPHRRPPPRGAPRWSCWMGRLLLLLPLMLPVTHAAFRVLRSGGPRAACRQNAAGPRAAGMFARSTPARLMCTAEGTAGDAPPEGLSKSAGSPRARRGRARRGAGAPDGTIQHDFIISK